LEYVQGRGRCCWWWCSSKRGQACHAFVTHLPSHRQPHPNCIRTLLGHLGRIVALDACKCHDKSRPTYLMYQRFSNRSVPTMPVGYTHCGIRRFFFGFHSRLQIACKPQQLPGNPIRPSFAVEISTSCRACQVTNSTPQRVSLISLLAYNSHLSFLAILILLFSKNSSRS
jgi:hypothetical protein